MIDFHNSSLIKLSKKSNDDLVAKVKPILLDDENIVDVYQAMRDFVIFTDKRIISANVQGITGKKVDFTSLPYKRISVFSVETAGVVDLDSELDLFFEGLGKVRFEFTGKSSILEIGKMIGQFVL